MCIRRRMAARASLWHTPGPQAAGATGCVVKVRDSWGGGGFLFFILHH